MKQQQISFIGLGLIGGSIAKSIKAIYPNTRIIALASHEKTIQQAYAEGIIDNPHFLPLKEYASSDVLFLCAPVGVNCNYLEQLKPFLSKDCLLTDVGSVKGDIQKAIQALGLEAQFIGGHPMAGSETIGFQHASAKLLENAYYILTYGKAMDIQTINRFASFIASLGAIPIKMTPLEHDMATGTISHLPHIISASLVNLTQERDGENQLLKTIAAGGFRDITRISSSSPVMWEHICNSNKDVILHLIDIYIHKLLQFKETLSRDDREEILHFFTSAKEYRDSLPIRNNGLISAVFAFYLDLDDTVGGISKVSTILAEHNINIKNIGIINNREFQDGALRIEFYDEASMAQAQEILAPLYTIHKAN